MKKYIAIAILGLVGITANAQSITTNNAGGLQSALANLPNTDFVSSKIEVGIGAVMRGASTFENELQFNYNFTTNFFVGLQIESASVSSVIDTTGIVFGIRKPWLQTEIYGYLGGRRNFTTSRFEGEGAAGIAYKPLTDLTGVSLFAEQRIIVTSKNGQPSNETVAGLRYSF